MSLARCLSCALLALSCASACASSPAAHSTTPPPGQPGAPGAPGSPPSGVTITSGSTAGPTTELTGTVGPRQGNEVTLTTSSAVLPRVGAAGVLFWVVDRPIAVFGQGTNLSLADVAVKQAQAGSIVLTIVNDSGPITINGQRINVIQAGQSVKLAYHP
jgi:hypothetical protein